MKLIKISAVFLICLTVLASKAQTISINCESGNKSTEQANCWSFVSISYSNLEFRINGNWSMRTNQLTNLSTTACWVKTPWFKPGSGNLTMKARLENSSGTSRAIVFTYVPYSASATNSSKEGTGVVFYTYNFATPLDIWVKDITVPIPSAIANSNQAYKVLISFIGSGGSGRAFIDDISMQGSYWADPSNSCLPLTLIIDSDGDGVQDSDDAYPKDAFRAYDNYYPAKTNGTLMFEDLWPSLGDYDFNDLVVGYRYNTITNSSNNIVEIKYEITPKAIGASLNNGFGIMLDGISAENIYSVEGLKTEAEWLSLNKNGTEANQKTATIVVFTSANNVLPNPGGSSGVNTDPKGTYVKPTTISFTVRFRDDEGKTLGDDISTKEFTADNFNPFIIVNQEREKEIHLPTYTPSSLASDKIFGTSDDNSKEGNYYKSKNGLPWALNVPSEIPNAIEKADFIKVYNYFSYWVETGGKEYTDWYEDKEKYRNNDALYIVK
ncbi:MAG: LruC domain-containing protein [Bacteroidia bacterium]|nr:LruC domain-containing protein [Bacteroidia bacterium]